VSNVAQCIRNIFYKRDTFYYKGGTI